MVARRLSGHPSRGCEVTTVAFAPDDRHVASGNTRGEVLLHSIREQGPLAVIRGEEQQKGRQGKKEEEGGKLGQNYSPNVMVVVRVVVVVVVH